MTVQLGYPGEKVVRPSRQSGYWLVQHNGKMMRVKLTRLLRHVHEYDWDAVTGVFIYTRAVVFEAKEFRYPLGGNEWHSVWIYLECRP